MGPTRTSTRRGGPAQNAAPATALGEEAELLFLDPLFGAPLRMYVDQNVPDRKDIILMITENGGTCTNSIIGANYILVDPFSDSGQTLHKDHANKKTKVVLDARWVKECVDGDTLQAFFQNWAGCKVTGTEQLETMDPPSSPITIPGPNDIPPVGMHQDIQHSIQIDPAPVVYNEYPYIAAPQPTWAQPLQPGSQMLPPHLRGNWPVSVYEQPSHLQNSHAPPMHPQFDYRRYDHPHHPHQHHQHQQEHQQQQYFDNSYQQPYNPQGHYMDAHNSLPQGPVASTSTLPPEAQHEEEEEEQDEPAEDTRGRRRGRPLPSAAPPPSMLVSATRADACSPSPPTRVVPSSFGGNLFTPEDRAYLDAYIKYCHEVGLVLSLREICERIAVTAPHHSFYSWRRYCNKHQVQLGGYDIIRPGSPGSESGPEGDEEEIDEEVDADGKPVLRGTGRTRNRSPTPPRALYRSTTGKGVAFTDEDVTFLVRFMDYRKRSQGPLDMVQFWKDVVVKAPHHSRASWMKFWRRHKHELDRDNTNAPPLPQAPEKKLRYSRDDDILLAKFFVTNPEGTSDKLHQEFGRLHPHHPWKGWQEHHRIHKNKVDYHMRQLTAQVAVDAARNGDGEEGDELVSDDG